MLLTETVSLQRDRQSDVTAAADFPALCDICGVSEFRSNFIPKNPEPVCGGIDEVLTMAKGIIVAILCCVVEGAFFAGAFDVVIAEAARGDECEEAQQ